MQSKFEKSATMTQTIFPPIICMGYQKTKNFMLIQNLLNWAQKIIRRKSYRPKTMRVFWILHFFPLFFTYTVTFFRNNSSEAKLNNSE